MQKIVLLIVSVVILLSVELIVIFVNIVFACVLLKLLWTDFAVISDMRAHKIWASRLLCKYFYTCYYVWNYNKS